MSDNWSQPPSSNGQRAENKAVPPSGKLLSNYRQQQSQPPSASTPQSGNAYSPMPPDAASQQSAFPAPRAQNWATGAMQMVRRWSGKVRAANGYADQDPGAPLVLYRPSNPPPVVQVRAKPWKRSRTMRITMQMRKRRERWHSKGVSPQKISIGVVLSVLLLLIIVCSSGAAYAYQYYQSQLPYLQQIANQNVEQTTRIYDRNNQLIYELSFNDLSSNKTDIGRRIPVDYKYIPWVMQDAMIAAEDNSFWTNEGVNPLAIVRTLTENAQAGAVQGGASTITQQLIKNLTNNKQDTTQRKIEEATLAIALTQQYSKAKILEMYFNVSPFGAQDNGVEAAVEDYFQLQRQCDANYKCIPAVNYLDRAKGPNDKPDPLLALARASLLAGLPQSPVTYDPSLSDATRKNALVRQQYVLDQMVALGMSENGLGVITPKIAADAEALTAKMTFPSHIRPQRSPHFVHWVIGQLATQLGDSLVTGGYNIKTTIDANLEDYVEASVKYHLRHTEYQTFLNSYGPLNSVWNVNDSAVVVMNAKTGEILAMDGSADFWDKTTDPTIAARIGGQVNAAVAPRPPGSSIKPIVYATAFQMGWYPGIVLPDVKTYFPQGGPVYDLENNAYHPYDYGQTYHNIASPIRLAIANSFNVPAVKALEFAGINNVADMARRLGITSIDQDIASYNATHGVHDDVASRFGPSFALGTADIPLIQMVGAYQAFANSGMRVPYQYLLDIWDNYGHNLYHYDPTHPPAIRVLSPQIAYLITSILTDENSRAIEFSYDHDLSFWDWDPTHVSRLVAAKTGTTENFNDNWTIGYTSDVVVGVWSGNANNDPMTPGVVGVTGAAPIWHDVMEHVSGRCDPTFFSYRYPDFPAAASSCFNYGFNDLLFQKPDGVNQYTISSVDGLKGGGNYDWMLDGEVPQQTGAAPGNGNGNGGGANGGGGNGKPTP